MIKMLKKNTVSILGSTGSIGTNTLNVISSNQKKFSVLSLSSKNNINLLSKQSVLYKPKIVAIQNKDKYKDLKNNLFGKRIKVVAGDEGVIECTDKKVDINNGSLKSVNILSNDLSELVISYEKNTINISEIIKFINEQNIKLSDISTDDGDLEDVFIRLTKN